MPTPKRPAPDVSDEAVRRATGKSWRQWFALLARAKAGDLKHKDIARLLTDTHGVDGWWAQSITVAFERETGRRKVGQTADGHYQTSVTRTFDGDLDAVLSRWRKHADRAKAFDRIAPSGKPAISASEKWRYWRVTLEDGSKLVVTIGRAANGKTQLAIGHEKLRSARAIGRWKRYWKTRIQLL